MIKHPAPQVCPSCHLEMPLSGTCDCDPRAAAKARLADQGKTRIAKAKHHSSPRPIELVKARYASRPWTSHQTGRPTPAYCDHPVPAAYVCYDCLVIAEKFFTDAPALLEDLDLAATKTQRFTQHASSTAVDESPVPFAEKAANLRSKLLVALDMAKDPRTTAKTRQNAPELFWEVEQLMLEAWRVIDRPRDLVYLGTCHCGTDLWADRGANELTCRACHTRHAYTELVEAIVSQAEDTMLPMSQILAAVPTLTRTQITTAARLGKITHRTQTMPAWIDGKVTTSDYTAYRLGDALDYATHHARIQASITSHQAASTLGLAHPTVRQLVRRGELHPIDPYARPLRFDTSEITRYQDLRKTR